MRATLVAIALGATLVASGCTSGPRASPSTARASAPPADGTSATATVPPRTVTGGCGGTDLVEGALPGWAADAGAPAGIPHAVSDHADAVGVLFGYPLRPGHPNGRSNKILWIVRLPRDGSPLVVRGTLAGGASTVTHSFEADSGPGEIYPSIVDVPRAGCWHFTLTWASHIDAIDLLYRSGS